MALNNDNNNECCKCTTPEYELILNEQGPQGRQGEKGDAGFTPIISVKDNTDSTYTLNILTQDGQITTPNLKANLPPGGAIGQVLTKNSANQDDCSWQNLPNATTELEGIARLASETDFTTTEDSSVSSTSIVTPALFNNELSKQVQNFIVAGNNITTSVGEDGKVTINSTAEPFTLPQATSTTLGGIKVGENLSITEDGTLSATGGVTELPQANATALGGIKANEKQDTDTQEVKIDPATGLLYTKAGGVEDYNELVNLPQINGVELKGNVSSNQLISTINGGAAESPDYITYYTVVGNPTISDDFIMTGANHSNYLNCDFNVPPSQIKNFVFEGKFIVSENAILETSYQHICGQRIGTTNKTSPQIQVLVNPDTSNKKYNQISLLTPISPSSWGNSINHYITDISKFPGTWYYKYIFNKQSQTIIGHVENLTNGYTPDDITISQSFSYWINPLSIGADSGAEYTTNNISIDLKSFKVNINNGKVDYQAVQMV